ncbi:carboxylesterase, type B family protein [Dictyostelium discoideum AX4]|uniref:Carboxylic ester hydrolase n=1 Tax=Dictyostelium discoideum TaxID=44689 RepID=Q54WD8_DICDI|nr:carboxylesterase, type B family protein [Dictyostelium discoideum AX4]EAL67633.1 carboxylesterase, type B family protein [Dictyostelium discoideum AX4]|eukprot:XP_641615.1 carboxylesterase, type B family protein [Dictyostelium discoideum AX4]
MKLSIVLLLILAFVFCSQSNASFFGTQEEFPLTVSSRSGAFQGILIDDARAFLGIPYAKPPTGPLRFKPPVSKPYSFGVQVAASNPKSCWQSGATAANSANYSEDCLYLNVFTPKYKQRTQGLIFSDLPVLVFIHGGRYWTGSAADFAADKMASVGNAVVVVIQYRLNIFGFQPYDSNTNIGLLDQQMALKWVQDNVRAFGGDANKVTIFGESAGGSSVLYHLLQPTSYSLYDRAILESAWQFVIPTVATARVKSNDYLIKKNCNRTKTDGTQDLTAILTCLQSLDPLTLTPTTGQSDFFLPMIDGKFITQLPLKSIKQRQYNQNAKIIIGHNYDEGYFMAYSRLGFKTINESVTDATYYSSLTKYLNVYFTPEQTQTIVDLYEPAKAALGNWLAASEFFGDYYITCGSILAAQYFNAYDTDFKTYIFNYSSPNYPASEAYLAASHGNELAYIFFNPNIYTQFVFGAADSLMSLRMNRAWTDFADSGNPISPLSEWPTNYPSAMYYGPDANSFGDSRPYLKDICESWRTYYEA